VSGRGDRPSLAVVFVQYDRAKYPRALPRLLGVLDRLAAAETTVVVVDNATEGDWSHPVSRALIHVGGDNRSWEFSAFDRGVEWLARDRRRADVYAFATDALLAYGDAFLEFIDPEVVDWPLLATACVGWMDSFGEECRILDYADLVWMRSSLLLMPHAVVEKVGPMAWPLDDAAIFGDSWREPFRPDAPVSPNLRRRLLGWLTTSGDDGSGPEPAWHSRFELGADTFGFFKSKVNSILREHLLSARLRELGVPCYDLRALRAVADAGIRVAGLGDEEARRWQWLDWFGREATPAARGPILVFAPETVSGTADESVGFLEREVMPLILQRHAAARLEIRPGAALGDATALLLPGPLSEVGAARLAEAAEHGVAAVGWTAGFSRAAAERSHVVPAKKSWEFAEACCRLIEERYRGWSPAGRAVELMPTPPAAVEAGPPAEGPSPDTAEEASPPPPGEVPKPAFPDGHFYSPVIDPAELREREDAIWSTPQAGGSAVDYREEAQRELLAAVAPYARDFDYPLDVPEADEAAGFYQRNGKFEGLDARMWFCLLRHLHPRHVIEVGGGFSTLLAADVNHRFLGGSVELIAIEPYPPPFLRDGVAGLGELRERKVQEVPVDFFRRLGEGDVLFIDSSHVAKTGSDVNYLILQVLPILRRGVVLHVHDIFLPAEYPKEWVLGEQRSWNEQYVVQALLSFSSSFEILFGSAYASRFLSGPVRRVFGLDCGGGSLWLRKLIEGGE